MAETGKCIIRWLAVYYRRKIINRLVTDRNYVRVFLSLSIIFSCDRNTKTVANQVLRYSLRTFGDMSTITLFISVPPQNYNINTSFICLRKHYFRSYSLRILAASESSPKRIAVPHRIRIPGPVRLSRFVHVYIP